MTSPSQLFPGIRASPGTPGSPPSEMSAPLSSLATSVPSVALSPSGEEERPLLLSNKSSGRDERNRTSAHYNHGHVAHSLPSSPLLAVANNRPITGDYDINAASLTGPASPEKVINSNNTINDSSDKRAGVTNGHVLHNGQCCGERVLASGTGEPQREHTDGTKALLFQDRGRTNPTSPNDANHVIMFHQPNKIHLLCKE